LQHGNSKALQTHLVSASPKFALIRPKCYYVFLII
jgi:hypothetical protein